MFRIKITHYLFNLRLSSNNFASIFVVLLIFIGTLDRRLFCSSRSLLESIENPTTFCILTGMVLITLHSLHNL